MVRLSSYEFPVLTNATVAVPLDELMKLMEAFNDIQTLRDENNTLEYRISRLEDDLRYTKESAKSQMNRADDLLKKVREYENAEILTKIPAELGPIHRESLRIALTEGKIQGIKYLRNTTGMGLREAKEDLEWLLHTTTLCSSMCNPVTEVMHQGLHHENPVEKPVVTDDVPF